MNSMTEHARAATALSDSAFHILLALADGPLHGYAIGKDVERQSKGRLGPDDADARRNYFGLTKQGRRAGANEARRLDALVRSARQRKLYPQRA